MFLPPLVMTNAQGSKRKRGQCKRGRRTHRLCTISGCSKQVQQGGVCCEHGAKTRRSPCTTDGCTNSSQRGGLCRRHGAFLLVVCHKEECKRIAKIGRFCDAHRVSSEDAQTETAFDEIMSMTIAEPSIHDEAHGYEFGVHDDMMPVHTSSNVEKDINEVDLSDLDIISMYLVDSENFICGTCITCL